MDNQERNYWLQVLPVMTESQISKLKDIFITEKKKLAEIEKKYSKPSFETISKKLETIKNNGNKISLFQIKIYITSINLNNLKKNKIDDFSTTLSSIKSNFINNHEYSFIFSLWLYKQKKYDEAIEYIIKSLDEKPYKIEYLESLAIYYEKSKQFELSREIYNKIFSIFHKYYIINTESNKTKFSLIKTNIKKGNSYYNEERSSEAKEIYYTVFNLTKNLLSKQNSEEDIISYYNDIRKLCVRCNSDIKDMRSLLEQEKILLLISDKLLTYEHTTDNLRRAYSSYWSAGFYASSINDNGELDKLAVQYTKKAITIVEEILSSTREEKYLLDYSSLLTNLTYNLIDTKSLKEASNIIKRNMDIGTEIQNSFNKTESLAKPYLTLSILNFYQRKFNNSIKFAKKALSLDDNTKSDIDIIIADNYLFTNKYNKAKEIYLDYKDKKYEIENKSDTGKIFNKIILEDFQKYRKKGLIHSNMAKIEDLMDILIEDVQFLLTELGYKPIEINNKLDKQTTTAIQLFQRKQNIKDDGKATPELVNALVAELYKKTERE